MSAIVKNVRNEPELEEFVRSVSADYPGKYVTVTVTFGEARAYVHDRKPSGRDTEGAEDTWRRYGGFFRDGEVVAPAPSLVKQWEHWPVLK